MLLLLSHCYHIVITLSSHCYHIVITLSSHFSLDDSELLYEWQNQTIGVEEVDEIKTLNAYLVGKEAKVCTASYTWGISKFSCLEVWLKFTRDKVFYLSTVFVPSIVLVTSSFITFWLDMNAVPARVMIGVTTMLNFCTTMNGFRSSLPVVSNLTAMNVWENVCMFFIYMSLIEFVVVNYMHRTRVRRSAIQAVSRFLSISQNGRQDHDRPTELQRQPTTNSTASASVNETGNVTNITFKKGWFWSNSSHEVAYLVDKTARYVFPITFISFVGAFLLAFWIMQQR
ncbi:Glycine receptor subunit alpha-3 [Nymphon striatum]|nr:Glycine receptor subunit alpha-3 [Nymphon striatum]